MNNEQDEMRPGDMVSYKGKPYRLVSDPTKTNALSLIPPEAKLITIGNQTIAPVGEVFPMECGHELQIISLHDAQLECSCGGWSLSRTDSITYSQADEEFEKHLIHRRKVEQLKPWAYTCDWGNCEGVTIGFRWDEDHDGRSKKGGWGWLPVCRKHLDEESDERKTIRL